jgi:hypothetical protein
MNEQIRELADSAHTQALTVYRKRMETEFAGNVLFYEIYNKLFAELIIENCIKIMHEQERLPPGYLHSQNALTHEYAIKKHFGLVE